MVLRVALPCVFLGLGCQFAAAVDGGDGSGGPDGGRDGADPTGDGPDGATVRRLEVTDAKVIGGPHTDFPVLVALTEGWLRETGSGGDVVHPAGFDIRFSADAAGTVPLAHELERYRGDTGELVAWVKVPMLSASTELYVHTGDPAITSSLEDPPAVWSAGYAAVWHLTDLEDSTARHPGTNNGSSSADGRIVGARSLDGSNDRIAVGAAASIDNVFSGGGTAEAWFTATGWGGNGLGRLFDKGSGSTVAIGMCNSNVQAGFLFGHGFTSAAGNWCTPAGSLALNTWTHVAVVYDDSSAANVPIIYIDGTARSLVTIGSPSGSPASDAGATLTLGDRVTTGRAFSGRIDEARLSRVPRGAGWIATTYENQRDPGTFVVVAP